MVLVAPLLPSTINQTNRQKGGDNNEGLETLEEDEEVANDAASYHGGVSRKATKRIL